jgi:hypothetical protein
MQLRTQLSDMKNVRKELEDLRAENSALQTKYVRFNLWLRKIFNGLFRYEAVNTQRNRDKQRMADLEKNTNDEKQNKQRLELQIKTEKTLTKKLQDDLTKLSLAPLRFVFVFFIRLDLTLIYYLEVNVQNNVWNENEIKRMKQEKCENYLMTKMNVSNYLTMKLK